MYSDEADQIVHEEGYAYDRSAQEHNCLVLAQDEALMYDDPMLSSVTSCTYETETSSAENEEELLVYCERTEANWDDSDGIDQNQLQCKWEDCYQTYNTQTTLVRHIEKCHVELKRGKYNFFSLYGFKQYVGMSPHSYA